ncbi:MAG TPA: c-type cytochrome [Gemmatimonadaceae bacterium]|nr:c-type cytochrome [Gemmatimonadaceae bacterium]
MTRHRVLPVVLVALVLASAGRSAAAQIPARFENLQVFPKDVPRDTLIATMRSFVGALGVRCSFCHVEREGPPPAMTPGMTPGPNLDFASDAKDHKKIARVMMRMVDSINTVYLARIPNRDVPPTNVACMTCHRGMSKPGTIESVLLTTANAMGVDSAIARYRTLRTDMASGKYNFSEQPVSDVARTLSQQGKHDQAIALLKMNQEFYPNSANLDFELAEAYIAKGDKEQGIARLRAVLAKNPNDRRAQQRLQQLGVSP